MATSLINTTPAATYESLLKLGDNSALSATLKRISDGAGNDTPIEISTAAVQFGGSTGMYWDNTNKRLGIGTNAPSVALQVTGTNQTRLSNILFGNLGNNVISNTGLDTSINVSNGVGISGITPVTPSARLHVRGSGATFATHSVNVEDSSGTQLFGVRDDGSIFVKQTGAVGFGWQNGTRLITFNYNSGIQIKGFASVALTTYDGANYTDALTLTGNGTQRIGIGTTSPNASARLDVSSTTLGFLPPRMTTAQRDAIVSPATGLKVYNTDLGTTDTYDGTTWQRVGRSTLIKGAGTTNATTALQVENSAGTSALTVNDAGYVGIGTNAPAAPLHITSSANESLIRLVRQGVTTEIGSGGSGNAFIGTISSAPFSFFTNNSIKAQISATGELGIGAANLTSARLHVRGSGATSATSALRVENSAGTALLTVNDAGTAVFTGSIDFQNIVGFRNSIDTQTALNLRFVVPGATKTFLINKDYTNSPSASALLQVDTTTQGFLPPRMTTTQKNAIASPAAGLVVYDTTTNKLCCYDGTIWNDLF